MRVSFCNREKRSAAVDLLPNNGSRVNSSGRGSSLTTTGVGEAGGGAGKGAESVEGSSATRGPSDDLGETAYMKEWTVVMEHPLTRPSSLHIS